MLARSLFGVLAATILFIATNAIGGTRKEVLEWIENGETEHYGEIVSQLPSVAKPDIAHYGPDLELLRKAPIFSRALIEHQMFQERKIFEKKVDGITLELFNKYRSYGGRASPGFYDLKLPELSQYEAAKEELSKLQAQKEEEIRKEIRRKEFAAKQEAERLEREKAEAERQARADSERVSNAELTKSIEAVSQNTESVIQGLAATGGVAGQQASSVAQTPESVSKSSPVVENPTRDETAHPENTTSEKESLTPSQQRRGAETSAKQAATPESTEEHKSRGFWGWIWTAIVWVFSAIIHVVRWAYEQLFCAIEWLWGRENILGKIGAVFLGCVGASPLLWLIVKINENFPSSSYSSSSGSASKHGDGLDDVLGSLLSGDGGTSSRRSSSSSSRAEKPKETEWVCTYCGKTFRRRSSTTGGPWNEKCAHHPDGFCKGRHHFVQVR